MPIISAELRFMFGGSLVTADLTMNGWKVSHRAAGDRDLVERFLNIFANVKEYGMAKAVEIVAMRFKAEFLIRGSYGDMPEN